VEYGRTSEDEIRFVGGPGEAGGEQQGGQNE
jgi:hypothetical protein